MKVEENALVRIEVKLFDLQGHLLEQTPEEGFLYWHGHNDLFPKLETALEGKRVQDTVSLILEPEDAFGEFDEKAIYLVDVDQLAGNEPVVPGLLFESIPGAVNDGRRYRVMEVAEGKALLDANHPYAGWTLRFEVKVLGIEKPTGGTEGRDDIVVPSFLSVGEKALGGPVD